MSDAMDSMNEMFQRLVVSGLINTSDLVEGGHCAAASAIMMSGLQAKQTTRFNEERSKRDRSDSDHEVAAECCTTPQPVSPRNEKVTFCLSDIDVVRKIAEAIVDEGTVVEDRDIDEIDD